MPETEFLTHQIQKSDVLPWVRNLLPNPSDLTQGPRHLVTYHWLYRTSRNFVFKQCHKNVRMTSVLFKMADVNAGYLLFKALAAKVSKKKNPTCVCG